MPVSPSPGQVYMVNGLIISQSPTPPADDADRMAAVYNHVKQSYDQAQKTFQRVLKRELKKADLPLPRGARFDVFAIGNAAQNAPVVIANQVYEALKRLQATNITPDQQVKGKHFVSEAKAGANFPTMAKDAEEFLYGLQDLVKIIEQGGTSTLKNSGAWRNIKTRFLRQSGQFKVYSARILSGNFTDRDAKQFINSLRAQFGNNFGLVMEDLIIKLMNTTEVQQRFASQIGQQIVKAAKPTNTHAVSGTVRASVDKISYIKDKNDVISLAGSGDTGNPLQDGIVQIKKIGPDGITVEVEEVGYSMKTINFAADWYKKNKNQVGIAELSIGNFADVFSNFYVSNRVGTTNTGVQGMYLYRTLTKYGNNQNPVALYIAQRKLNDILFSGLTDKVGIVIINGIAMNAAEYYAQGEIGISTSGLPKRDGEWVKPEEALNYIATIHSAKLKAFIRLDGAFVQSL